MTQLEKSLTPQEALAHYGVKGMKWGRRRSDKELARASASRGKVKRGLTKANVALDAGSKVINEGEKKLIFLPQKDRNKAAARTQARVLGEAAAINRSPQFKGKDLKGNTRLKNAYFKKVEEAAKKTYVEELDVSRTEAWGDFLGVDTRHATNTMRITAARDRIRHADADDQEVLLEMKFETNDLGQIVKINVPEEYLKHSDGTDETLRSLRGEQFARTILTSRNS